MYDTKNWSHIIWGQVNSECNGRFFVASHHVYAYLVRDDDNVVFQHIVNDGTKLHGWLWRSTCAQCSDWDGSKAPGIFNEMPGDAENWSARQHSNRPKLDFQWVLKLWLNAKVYAHVLCRHEVSGYSLFARILHATIKYADRSLCNKRT